jgi:hypothetical protein
MTTVSSQTLAENERQQLQEILDIPLPGTADLFTAVDFCASLVSVMVECEEEHYRLALCGRLAHALTVLNQRCADDMPDWMVRQLTMGTVPVSSVLDCWEDTETLVEYAQALTLALSGNTLLAKNAQDLVGLLHDLVYLLVDQLKTPFMAHS